MSWHVVTCEELHLPHLFTPVLSQSDISWWMILAGVGLSEMFISNSNVTCWYPACYRLWSAHPTMHSCEYFTWLINIRIRYFLIWASAHADDPPSRVGAAGTDLSFQTLQHAADYIHYIIITRANIQSLWADLDVWGSQSAALHNKQAACLLAHWGRQNSLLTNSKCGINDEIIW